VKAAVLALLGILDDLDAAVPAGPVVDPLAAERQAMERALKRLSQRQGAVDAELARLNRGLPGSAAGVSQSISITGVQANELLSVTRTNAFHNARTADNTDVMKFAMTEMARVLGGDVLAQRVNEQLARKLQDEAARQGLVA
jgi:hypothetical protein